MSRNTRVYQGHGPADAHLVRNWLEQNGVAVEMRGEHLMGIAGAIPTNEAWPSLWVRADQSALAQELVRRFEAEGAAAAEAGPWTCGACGAEVDAHFGECWSCGLVRPR